MSFKKYILQEGNLFVDSAKRKIEDLLKKKNINATIKWDTSEKRAQFGVRLKVSIPNSEFNSLEKALEKLGDQVGFPIELFIF